MRKAWRSQERSRGRNWWDLGWEGGKEGEMAKGDEREESQAWAGRGWGHGSSWPKRSWVMGQMDGRMLFSASCKWDKAAKEAHTDPCVQYLRVRGQNDPWVHKSTITSQGKRQRTLKSLDFDLKQCEVWRFVKRNLCERSLKSLDFRFLRSLEF